ncbi:MAG: hypothetical protein HRT71_07410 [Flavobacteriales bacterium]|nr:hypothetical protein [Flavobacteriales bacterium]
MNLPNLQIKASLKILALSSITLMMACGQPEKPKEDTPATNDEVETTAGYITISPKVPTNPASQLPEELAKFAWEEFFALSWQSSWKQNSAQKGSVHLRGTANTKWNPTTDYGTNYEIVWETYAHVTELRPGQGAMKPFDDPPHYSYVSYDIAAHPAVVGGNLNPALFNNLDEDSEIGSCNVYPPKTVIDGTPTELVLYQAKTNRDEYDYIKKNYDTKSKLSTATTLTAKNILQYNAYYDGGTSNCGCPDGIVCLPCGGDLDGNGVELEGAIEVKTAWRKVRPGENTSSFFTRNNLYYELNNGDLVYNNAPFVLIGIHIIHKTKDNPEFIFASWEHVGVEALPEDEAYQLQLLDTGKTLSNKVVGTPHTYSRFAPVPEYLDQVTAQVHEQLATQNLVGFDIWKNYRLIGVQGKPVDYKDKNKDPNYFMANYVIESDLAGFGTGKPGLADFHGSGFSTVPKYVNEQVNILDISEKKFLDAGGCIGCHGVAQTFLGTDFSFLLDDVGKPVPQPSTINTIIPLNKTNAKQYLTDLKSANN